MADWEIPAFIKAQTKQIIDIVGDQKAIVAVSGGVDSTVSAKITQKAIGDNLICIFIDDNFMRLGEGEQIKSVLGSEPINLPVKILNERQRFMSALEGISDAEEKRKIFRNTFYNVLSSVAQEENCKFLVQGTIKADIEETEKGIKTQHNILNQIGIDSEKKYGLKVIEPLKTLYKHQVRDVSRYLEIPPQISERQPFPGPGLSVRVVGEITANKLEEIKKVTFIVEEILAPHLPSQYFAAIFSGESSKELKAFQRDAVEILNLVDVKVRVNVLKEKATGMINGKRVYGSVITVDFLDASDNPVYPGYENMILLRNYMEDNYPEVARVMFLVEKKEKEGFYITIRAIKSHDFLTAEIVEIPWSTLREASSKILETCTGVAAIYYDVTPKPPATIEFE